MLVPSCDHDFDSFRRENTWEPLENLQNSMDAVKKYEERREYYELVSAIFGSIVRMMMMMMMRLM